MNTSIIKVRIIKNMLILVIFIINIENCYGANVGFGTLSEGGDIGEIPYENVAPTEYKSGKKKFEYKYQKRIVSNTSVSINAYDTKGASVMPSATTIDNTKHVFKSGTWIGINVTEHQEVEWSVKGFSSVEKRKKYICKYKSSSYTPEPKKESVCTGGSVCKTTCNNEGGIYSEIYPGFGYCMKTIQQPPVTTPGGSYTTEEDYDYYYDDNPCKSTYNGQSYDSNEIVDVEKNTHTQYDEEMKQKAYTKVYNEAIGRIGSALGIVEYIINNEYPNNINDIDFDKLSANPGTSYSSGVGESGRAYKDYEYVQDKICMNLKTARVTYGENCKVTNNEIEIPNGTIYDQHLAKKVNYWHYFIPLNTKSNNNAFFLRIVANKDRKLTVDECKDAMKKYSSNYPDIIIPNLDGDKFDLDNSKQYNENIITENNGCYFATTIYIPVVQKFYNEVKNNGVTKFKGFNFYYKPIPTKLTDSDNIEKKVFPNGVSDNSIWKYWYDNTAKDKVVAPNLTNEKITYIADVSKNLHKIRNHNKTYPYTTWENMYTNGTSSFIANNTDIFTTQDDNYYKLGCGPANDNTTDNLYQRWCGTE
jgi:hypothetical protein